jgi:hypothetical protein
VCRGTGYDAKGETCSPARALGQSGMRRASCFEHCCVSDLSAHDKPKGRVHALRIGATQKVTDDCQEVRYRLTFVDEAVHILHRRRWRTRVDHNGYVRIDALDLSRKFKAGRFTQHVISSTRLIALARNSCSALEAEVAFNTAYPFCSRTFALSQSWVSLSSTQRIVSFGKYAGKEHIYGLGQERIGVRPLAQKAVEA